MTLALSALLLTLSAQAARAPEPPEKVAQAPSPATAKLFPRVDGWKLAGAPTEYTPENLFEYIDGGAEAFLQFDFEALASASYVNAGKVEINVDIYRHRGPVRAFGMYTQERSAGSTPVPVGIEGSAGADHLEFVVGSFYVKMVQAGGKESYLRPLADKIAAKLPGTREAPAVLKYFPDRGKRPRSERLAARDFLGHAFLHDAATASYQLDGAQFRLFVVEGKDDSDARTMLQRYRAVAKAEAVAIEKTGGATLKDPLNGEILLRWSGRWLWGAVDQPSPHWQALVDELGRNLQSGQR